MANSMAPTDFKRNTYKPALLLTKKNGNYIYIPTVFIPQTLPTLLLPIIYETVDW